MFPLGEPDEILRAVNSSGKLEVPSIVASRILQSSENRGKSDSPVSPPKSPRRAEQTARPSMKRDTEPVEPEPTRPRRLKAYPASGQSRRLANAGGDGDGRWELPICGDLTDRQWDLVSRLVEV